MTSTTRGLSGTRLYITIPINCKLHCMTSQDEEAGIMSSAMKPPHIGRTSADLGYTKRLGPRLRPSLPRGKTCPLEPLSWRLQGA